MLEIFEARQIVLDNVVLPELRRRAYARPRRSRSDAGGRRGQRHRFAAVRQGDDGWLRAPCRRRRRERAATSSSAKSSRGHVAGKAGRSRRRRCGSRPASAFPRRGRRRRHGRADRGRRQGSRPPDFRGTPKSPARTFSRAPSKMRRGEIVVARRGAWLRPEDIGLLAMTGHAAVRVSIPQPAVAVLSTGDEIVSVPDFRRRAPGQIRNSNAPMLLAQVQQRRADRPTRSALPETTAVPSATKDRAIGLSTPPTSSSSPAASPRVGPTSCRRSLKNSASIGSLPQGPREARQAAPFRHRRARGQQDVSSSVCPEIRSARSSASSCLFAPRSNG